MLRTTNHEGEPVNIETATADELYRLLLDVQDQLNELVAENRLTLARDAEQIHGTARNAVGVVVHHLDAARQVLAVLETRG
jgi:hypothetical protein